MIVRFLNCELDRARLVLTRDGSEVRVEPQVYDLLLCLLDRRGEVVRKEEILDAVWGDRFVSESALTTRIKSARRAVGDDGTRQQVIRTVHGRGYEFVAEVEVVGEPAASGAPAGSGEVPQGVNLPAALQPLIGRSELVDQLCAVQAAHRLVTLVGPGGVGKTSVAYELARSVAGNYADGVFVVELAAVDDRDAAVAAFATCLDVSTPQRTSIDEAIIAMLRPRHALLVLDNCEHVIEPVAAMVDQILRAAPRVSIITTSREPLAVAGEHVWTVDPLATADLDAVPAQELSSVPVIALFLQRARAADPRFELDDTTGPPVVEICRRLDGIPLAIELAAARASAIDVAEIAERLDERFRLLKAVRRGAERRHQTLHDAISWSYDLLDDEERRLFAALAVFAGPFDLADAESLWPGDDVVDLLTRLTQRSMVAVRRPTPGRTRYEMLETLRAYGLQQMGDQERFELFATHAEMYTSLARSVERDLRTDREQTAVRRADGSFADLRAAQRFALQVEDFDTAFGLMGAIREYAMRTLRYEAFAWADATAERAPLDHPLLPVVLGVRGYGAFCRGEFDRATALANQARAAEDALGLTPSGLVERVLANVSYSEGDVAAGHAETARMIALAEDSGDPSRIAHACYMTSVAASSTGSYDEAMALIARARAAASRSQSPTDLASGYVAEGFASVGDPLTALELFATAEGLARDAGNRWMTTFARCEASGLLVHRGQLGKGCEGLAEAVDVWYRAGEWAQQWHTLSRCVIALDKTGHHDLAAQVLGAIEAHATLGGPPVMTTLRDLTFETRDGLAARLGAERCGELRALGASLPVAAVVDRTRQALLGRDRLG